MSVAGTCSDRHDIIERHVARRLKVVKIGADFGWDLESLDHSERAKAAKERQGRGGGGGGARYSSVAMRPPARGLRAQESAEEHNGAGHVAEQEVR